uniref:Signal transducing adaptor family member 2a n=1 Tax=Oryzias sinensis TaxID=183150 RepID=A0A8C8E4M8_9TELE
MAAAPVRQRSGSGGARAQLPPCYYEGYLEKRGPKEKVRRFEAQCRCALHDTFLQLKSVNSPPWLLNVPTSLTLLPGQLQMLKEVVDKERSRRRTRNPARAPPSPLSVPLVGEIPACFRPVSRTEAEVLLERHPDCGNMLLRPGRDGCSLAVTTRQDLNGSVFRHYRVTQRDQGGYIIDVENPIPCATLHDVIDALVEKTAGTLQPFLLEEPYEENISEPSSFTEPNFINEGYFHSFLSKPKRRLYCFFPALNEELKMTLEKRRVSQD